MIDIITPTHNNVELTKSCIECLYSNTKEPFNLIVIDDSTDGTKEYIESLGHDNLTLIHSVTPYKSGNQIFNTGLLRCTSDYVALVMNSVTVEPDWETSALLLMDIAPDVGIVGLKCLSPDGLIESAGLKLVDAKGVARRDYEIATKSFIDIGLGERGHRHSLTYECDAVQWASCILRRGAIPVLEEDIYHGFLGWDDVDNCYTLKKNGWKVLYCGTGVCYHKVRATREDSSKEADKKNNENAYKFFERWGFLK